MILRSGSQNCIFTLPGKNSKAPMPTFIFFCFHWNYVCTFFGCRHFFISFTGLFTLFVLSLKNHMKQIIILVLLTLAVVLLFLFKYTDIPNIPLYLPIFSIFVNNSFIQIIKIIMNYRYSKNNEFFCIFNELKAINYYIVRNIVRLRYCILFFFFRIRPQTPREIIDMCHICTTVTPGEPQVTLGSDKAFTYNHVFDMESTQGEIYENTVASLVESSLEG